MRPIVVVGEAELRGRLAELEVLGRYRAEATVGTNLVDPPYPYFLEYGTRYMAARPTARPAFDSGGPKAQQVAARVLQSLVARMDFSPSVLLTAIEAGALAIQNDWKRNIVAYPVVRTGTYLRSVAVSAELVW